MKFVVVSVVLALVAGSSALFFKKDKPLTWDKLSVTWGPIPIKGKYYDTMPLTTQEAEAAGWEKVSSSCLNDGKFAGFRYILGDTSMNLIFNVNGAISGIQMNPKVSEITANGNDYRFDDVSMFQKNTIDNDEVYTLTAYFADPSTICDSATASTADSVAINGIGEQLFFQDGESSAVNYAAPKARGDAFKSGWNKNNCFPGMGWHTWYKSEELQSENCQVDRPVFLLFNKKQELIGFGFNLVGTANSPSNRYEHPPLLAVKTIMGNPPNCLIERQKKVGLTTMHVFFVGYSEIPKLDCVNPF
jgi:hypothetical protein